jgi:hypothetical protein
VSAPIEKAVRRVLDLSTGHLPQQVCNQLNSYEGVTAYELSDHGWLCYVPEDPEAHANDYGVDGDGVPSTLLRLQVIARAAGCDYLLFDRDAARIPGLPRYDW